jgi:hypothetical protein
MMQLSRPFQIVLVAFCLFAAVWFFALRSHSSSTSGGGSAASSSPSASSASTPAAQPASPGTPYHGSAPGVGGLTRAIEKAQGAVAQSERNAKQLQEKAAQASGTAASSTAAGTPNSAAPASKSTATAPKSAAAVHNHSTATLPKSAPTAAKSATGASGATGVGGSKAVAAPTMQVVVEGALKRGQLVTLLFWNPKGIVDRTVHRELQSVGRSSSGKVAVFAAGASQVGSFGSFTKAVQVNQTPTIVIVTPRGQAQTLTGLADVFSIEQAIGEARKQK